MKAKIALATVSGRAYYRLVNELKRKGLLFWSLKPWDPIPLEAKVVITTNEERHYVTHPNVLIFDYESDPEIVVNEAIRVVQGKPSYEKVVIGVDPGKTYGVAVLGDDNILKTTNCSSLEETVTAVLEGLGMAPATISVVKVGDGAPAYAKELLHSLDETLPEEVTIEIVSEAGTSRFMNETAHRRELRNMMSAIEIAGRKGQAFHRKKML
ncbi:MAG: hypothetical protein ACUVRA_02005 [Candidatus Bathyarchaeaceae archaeon]